jgi:predicted Fe-Mo cluster-binding NifX family protein
MNRLMKIQKKLIAMPVSGYDGVDSKVSVHFGKSRGFIIIDEGGGELSYLDTALCAQHSHSSVGGTEYHPQRSSSC